MIFIIRRSAVEEDQARDPDEGGERFANPERREGAGDEQRDGDQRGDAQFLLARQSALFAEGDDVRAERAMRHQPLMPALAAARKTERRQQQEWRGRQQRRRDADHAQSDTDETRRNVDSGLHPHAAHFKPEAKACQAADAQLRTMWRPTISSFLLPLLYPGFPSL